MASTIIMPQLGETVAEGKILAWFKSVGDEIKEGDNLFEVETDKVTIEVQAIVAGTPVRNPRRARGDGQGRRSGRGCRRRRDGEGAGAGEVSAGESRAMALALRRSVDAGRRDSDPRRDRTAYSLRRSRAG